MHLGTIGGLLKQHVQRRGRSERSSDCVTKSDFHLKRFRYALFPVENVL